MDTKVACLLLIVLGALTVQGAVSGHKRMNPLNARQYERECMDNGDELCMLGECPPNYYSCSDKYCEGPASCCCRSW